MNELAMHARQTFAENVFEVLEIRAVAHLPIAVWSLYEHLLVLLEGVGNGLAVVHSDHQASLFALLDAKYLLTVLLHQLHDLVFREVKL